jgi:prepilin-type N-terminal cleavage/methylation domain-containing protein/prepilin-type processing-associated H-X9-DG protein
MESPPTVSEDLEVFRMILDRYKHKRFYGFTLVELLVVISIIALLLAILMPSLQRAREQAKSILCKSNIKQYNLSCLNYSNNWEGRYPGSNFWDSNGKWNIWFLTLGEGGYLPKEAYPDLKMGCPNVTKSSAYRKDFGYGMSLAINPSYLNVTGSQPASLRISKEKRLSTFLVIADSGPANPFRECEFSLHPRNGWETTFRSGYIGNPHNDHTNVLFGDSHIESLEYQEPFKKGYFRWFNHQLSVIP